MPLKIHYKSGPLKGHSLDFDDDRDMIQFGRDAELCDVVLPMSDTMVSREHCALRRVLGRYRLVTNGVNPVYLDGRPGQEDEVLEPLTDMQLGEDGPVLLVETVQDHRLEATTSASERPETAATLRQRLRRSVLTNRIVALVAVVLVLGAAVVMTVEFKRQRTAVSTLSEKEQENLASILKKIHDEDPGRRFRDTIARVVPSIYLVMIQDKADPPSPVGTAWVVGKGVLATNAHVAELHESLKPDQKLLVRSSTEKPLDVTVTSVTCHPGYHRFQQAVANHHPLDPTSGETASFIQACDVGLLHVDPNAVLGPPLPIAPDQVLYGLEAGETVAFVGHPLEGIRLRDISRPEPTSQIGHITSLTDEFNGKTIPARRFLVRHNLPLTGGVSGSPLLNRDGQVVAVISAGSFHFIADPLTGRPRRVPTFVGINFAQRADLLAELVQHRAEKAQAERDRVWATDLARFKSGRKSRDELVKQLQRYFEIYVKTRGSKLVSVEKVLEQRGRVDKVGLTAGVAFRIDVAQDGYYLVSAVADEVKDLDMAAFEGSRLLQKDEMRDHYPSVILRLTAGTAIKVLIYLKKGKLPETDFTLLVFRGVE